MHTSWAFIIDDSCLCVHLLKFTGAVMTTLVGENALKLPIDDQPKDYRRFDLYATRGKSAFLADLFASFSLSAQYGNFQKRYFDLTRLNARLDVPSASKFFSAAACVAQNISNSKQPSLEAVQAVCPKTMLSFQQQVRNMVADAY